MKALIGKPTISGAYEEDLENVLIIFATLLAMCAVTQE